MQQRRHALGVGDDAGDVGGRGEAADAQRTVAKPAQVGLEVVEVDVTVDVLADRHHVRDRLSPGQLVAVVLERSDEDHRALVRGDVVGQAVAAVEVGGEAQVQGGDQPVDRAGRPRPAEQHDVLLTRADRLTDDLASVLAKAGRLQAGARALGVGVAVERQHGGADEVLDEVQRAARRRVVGVGDAPRTVGAVEHLALTDHPAPHALDQPLAARHHGKERATAAPGIHRTAPGGSCGGSRRPTASSTT